MKFSKQFLMDTNGDENDVINEISGTSRWSVLYDRIFKYEGNLYSADYRVGATEQQDERPYEFEDDEIECPEMEEYTKTIKAYRLKK